MKKELEYFFQMQMLMRQKILSFEYDMYMFRIQQSNSSVWNLPKEQKKEV